VRSGEIRVLVLRGEAGVGMTALLVYLSELASIRGGPGQGDSLARAPTDEQVREEFWPHWPELIRLVAVERGFAIPTEESFAYETGPQGALYVGSPETVAQKIATNLRTLDATRLDLKYGAGGLPNETLMTNIELYGRQVIPRVRELLPHPALGE
jgi:hypothetical protein